MSDPFNKYRLRADQRGYELRVATAWGDGMVTVALRKGALVLPFTATVAVAQAWLDMQMPLLEPGAPKGNRNARRENRRAP